MRYLRRPSHGTVVAYLALFVALGGGALATTSFVGSDGQIHGCVGKKGQLVLIKPGKKCKKGSPISWNQQGAFPGTLPAGKTLRGDFDVGGTAVGSGELATGDISFGSAFASAPIVIVVAPHLAGAGPCAGGKLSKPVAAPGHVCIYEKFVINSSGVGSNPTNRFGVQLYASSSSNGDFSVDGTWAATSP
jgi:hypothetical protein